MGSPLATQASTIELENRDRIARFQRLASLQGIAPPLVDQLYAPPGSVPGVEFPAPVVRVVFQEDTFFASGSDEPLPQAGPVFDLIAENMRRDVPDAALTVLGHTDATGSDALNMDLSRRRAASVMAALIARGVPASQLDTVAIGKSQPIASNMTAAGRARNRRVEFMISGSDAANLSVITHRQIFRPYLALAERRPAPRAAVQVAVFRPERAPQGPTDFSFLKQTGTIALATPSDVEPPEMGQPAGHAPKDIEPPAS
jgi:outer membrane protein OmpA-like peptidoglycan-associated protein